MDAKINKYVKTLWQDHIVEKPNTFKFDTIAGGTNLSPAFGKILKQGTPANVYNMNKIEQGVYELYKYANNLSLQTKQLNSNIMDLAFEIKEIKNAELVGVNTNIYLEHFNDLNDIILLNGKSLKYDENYKLTITDY